MLESRHGSNLPSMSASVRPPGTAGTAGFFFQRARDQNGLAGSSKAKTSAAGGGNGVREVEKRQPSLAHGARVCDSGGGAESEKGSGQR